MKIRLIQLILFTIIFLLPSCSGSSSDGMTRFFPGTWEAVFTILIDECGLLPEDQLSFTDEHVVNQESSNVTVDTLELPSGAYRGAIRAEDSFLATNTLEGDIFGSGVNCVLKEDLAYNDLDRDSLNTIYNLRITCDDGSVCDSFARGTAKRIN